MRFLNRTLFALLLCCMAAANLAQASEADEVRKAVNDFFGGPAVDSITKTEYGELYEVLLIDGEIVYTDKNVSYILGGRLIDTKLRQDITQARKNVLSAIDFSELPLDQAIKQVKGKGSRVVVTFEDPNCGFCNRLAEELAKVDDVTIYTFLYPILTPDSFDKSVSIWCADDRATTWRDWLLKKKEPPVKKCDDSVIGQNIALGRKLKISGTPTLFFADGTRGNYAPAEELALRMDEAKQ